MNTIICKRVGRKMWAEVRIGKDWREGGQGVLRNSGAPFIQCELTPLRLGGGGRERGSRRTKARRRGEGRRGEREGGREWEQEWKVMITTLALRQVTSCGGRWEKGYLHKWYEIWSRGCTHYIHQVEGGGRGSRCVSDSEVGTFIQ